MESMRFKEEEQLLETCDFLSCNPGASSLAGVIFETIAHRHHALSSESAPQPTALFYRGDPPTFSTSAPSPLDTAMGTMQSNRARALTRVDIPGIPTRVVPAGTLDEVTLYSDKYYIPISSVRPPFTSFAINRDDKIFVVISVFKITTLPNAHGIG